MAYTRYATILGNVLGEFGPNGARYYHNDALGSVTTSQISGGNVLSQFRFKPSGASLSQSEPLPGALFLWVGTRGYWSTGEGYAEFYIRGRHYSSTAQVWTSRDSLFPSEPPYAYASSNPTSFTDPSGLARCADTPTAGLTCSCSGFDLDPKSACAPPNFTSPCCVSVPLLVSATASYSNSYPPPPPPNACIAGTLIVTGTYLVLFAPTGLACCQGCPLPLITTFTLSVSAVSGATLNQVWEGWHDQGRHSAGPTPPDFDTQGGSTSLKGKCECPSSGALRGC